MITLKTCIIDFRLQRSSRGYVNACFGRLVQTSQILYSILPLNSIAGVGAIQMIRKVENQRYGGDNTALKEDDPYRSPLSASKRAKILALSGLASNEDKLRAFNAGVDG